MDSLSLLSGILLILSLIGIAALSSLIFKKLNFPYTIGLVVVGIIIGTLSILYPKELAVFGNLQLSSDIILYLILPVLVFDAALNVDSKVLFKNIVPIVVLAAFGLLISAFIVGGLLSLTLGLSFGAMLLFGALISATDPVAVIALFKEVSAPKRLTTIIDGESMANDATAIVLFGIVFSLTYIKTGSLQAAQSAANLNIPLAIWNFFAILAGGTAVGAAVGLLGSYICKLDKDRREYQIVLSVIMAYSAFIIADQLEFSGVMASLAAGVALSLKAEDVIKRKNREQVETFWGFFSFLANSFVFLLMGMTQAHIFSQSPITTGVLAAIVVSIVVLLIARYVSVIACNAPYNFFVRKKNPELVISHNYSLILTWGGLRGAIPTALALAIPVDYPHRGLIVQLTLACILFSLFAEGTTVKKLMDKLGIKPENMEIDENICAKKEYSFLNKGLIDLIITKIIKHCEEEGFFIREKLEEEQRDYMMQMRKHTFLFRATDENIQVVAEPKDIGYASTIMYETVIELNQSLGSIAEVMRPDKLNQIISNDDSESETTFNYMKYLSSDSVIVPLKTTEKKGVIRELVDILEKSGKISNLSEVYDEVLEREKSMSTGLGDGVAFPHARTDSVENITAAIGVLPDGIEFEAIDKKPVYIVVLILSPKKDSTPHLQFLSEMSKILSKANVREKIINAQNSQILYEILKEKDW
ncbi:MAG: cation:proton antiporter [Chitinispirillales bacterium]|nr:cation:proton antiporter [Chitinispirillales bacterium]